MLVEDNLINMKSLTEEQKRMRELMGFTYKDNSHDILSEQLFSKSKDRRRYRKNKRKSKKSKGDGNIAISSRQADWNEKNTGTAYLTLQAIGYPAAYNIGDDEGMLWSMSTERIDVKPENFDIPTYTSHTKDEPGYTIQEFNVGEFLDFYPDNMVMPRLENQSIFDEFQKIVEQFVRYIDAGGLDKLNNVTIQGQADKANPTWDIPSSYQKLDHKYGGMKKKKQSEYTDDELDQMNTFLAKERAFNFKMALINAIKEETGEKIEIKELTPINHRGQEGKRGGKYRSILLKPNAPIHKVVITDPVKKKEYDDMIKKRKEYENSVKSGLYPTNIYVNINGKLGILPGISVNDTTQKSEQIVDVYTDISPGMGNRYSTKKVYVRAEKVNELNFGKLNSDTILKNMKCTRQQIVVNAGRGDIIMNMDRRMDGKSEIGNAFANNGNVGGHTRFFNAKANDPYTLYGQPLTYTTNEIKKINGFTYFRIKNQWFAYATTPYSLRSRPLNNPKNEEIRIINLQFREDD